MKKFVLCLMVAVAMLQAGELQAQNKYGHVSLEDVVSILPEIKRADTAMAKFRQDSLQSMLPYYLKEYQRYDSISKSTSQPAAVKQKAGEEAARYGTIIQNWEQYAQSELQRKQQEILQPLFAKAFQLVSDVAKENGYSWVFRQESLLAAPPTDDLLPLVAKKIGVKLPAADGPAGNAPGGATRPATGTRPKP